MSRHQGRRPPPRRRKFQPRQQRELLTGEEWPFDKGDELWPPPAWSEGWAADIVDMLDEPYKSVAEMRIFGRLSHSEIARRMGWKDKRWSATYMKRAREKLRVLFEQHR